MMTKFYQQWPHTSFSVKMLGQLATVISVLTAVASQQHDVTYRIKEEQPAGTYVGDVARDSFIYSQFNQAELQRLQYSIPSTSSKLSIDSKTSKIKTAQVIDREKVCDNDPQDRPCVLNLDVSVYRVNSDGSYNLLRIIKVKIIIEDINDNAPEFPSNQTILDVPENMEVNQLLRMSGAIDKDTGINNTVQKYRLEGGMDIFDLHTNQSAGGPGSDFGIVLKKKLDRETKSSYQLKVIAEDGGFPRMSGSVDILIKVIDVNDNVPRFTRTSFDATVREDTPVGSVVLTLQAVDPDEGENGRLTYAFSSMTSSKVTEYLAISEETGDMYLIKRLDYEKDKSFRFTVAVSDNGAPPRSSQATLHVLVQDVNDNAPQIEITLPSSNIKESMGVGNYIAHVSLSDLDSSENSQITCSIANEHFMLQKFSNSDSIFTVILRSHLDYEKSHVQLVNVTCHDGGQPPLYNSSAFTVYVQDVNDNAPVFTKSKYQTKIDEDSYIGQFVIQVQAVDPDEGDNGNVSYSLAKNPENKFQINPVSGVVKVAQTLDHELNVLYELEVVAKDRGSIPISSSVTVTVVVGDVNDNPPQFLKPFFEMRVQENQPKYTTCDSVTAHDLDKDVDSHLRFQFTSNFTYPDIFDINRMSGSIYTLVPLDRELKDTYSFEVMVFDESQPSFLDVAKVTVIVQDENDNKPNIIFPGELNNTFHFTLTTAPGSILLTVEAEDLDAGENKTVRFAIVQGNDRGLLFLNSVSGELGLAKRLNIYDVGSYSLVILARDEGEVYLESIRDVNIVFSVANGTASYFQEDESKANIAIVIALVCITSVLAVAVLVTICIIRRIDRERKHHASAKCEEENIYKQQVPTQTPVSSPRRGDFENEIEKLKRKIKRDLSFVEEDDTSPMDTSTKTSFSTFRNTTSESEQRNLSSTISSNDANVKRVQYMDKRREIDRLTTTASPVHGQSASPTYQSGHCVHWPGGLAQSPHASVITHPVEDASSHSSGSTSDSGRGGSSEEGEGQGHTHAVIVAIGDGDHGRVSNTYTTSAHLITFGSPRSGASSSSTSHQPRSLSTSLNSETARKRLWGDTPTTSTSAVTASSGSPERKLGMPETSAPYGPNISFSDDSVTANTTVGNTLHAVHIGTKPAGLYKTEASHLARLNSSLFNQANSESALNCGQTVSPKQVANFTSTDRHRASPQAFDCDTQYALLGSNISRIPNVDSSVRHGMFVEGISLTDPPGSGRSRSYARATRMPENLKSVANNSFHSNNSSFVQNKCPASASGGLRVVSPTKRDADTENTTLGNRYSLNDLKDALDEGSIIGSNQDDDNTTTTSGSYTINADDLCQEIDQLFFSDVVV